MKHIINIFAMRDSARANILVRFLNTGFFTFLFRFGYRHSLQSI